jgi:hypothetical protein
MRKHKVELIVLLLFSIGGTVLVPNYLMWNSKVEIVNFPDFLIWTLIIFTLLSLAYFAVKPPLDNETKKNMKPLPDGYQELYNEKDQITKKGFFIGGQLCDGAKYIYKKDNQLSHIGIFKDGNCVDNSPIEK